VALTVNESILSNGLKILHVHNPVSPTASMQLYYRVGSRNERPGITGISHVFEHLMFKGTERFPEGVFDRVVQEQGMTYNAFTTSDFTCYLESMAADRLDVAMELEADRMQGLAITEESFRSEMAVIREERRQTVEDPPAGLLIEAVQAAVFMAHPYHWPVIGWMTDLESLGLDDVLRYYRDHYRPNNAVLVVVGDVTAERVLASAERYFGRVPRGPELAPLSVVEPEQRGERTVSIHKEVQLPMLVLAYRAPQSSRRDAKVLNAIEFLLLHGRSSRLYQRLVYQEQLVVGLGGGVHLRVDPSVFDLRFSARPGVTVDHLRDRVYQLLDELRREPVSDEELHKTLNAVEADYVFSQESNAELAQNLGEDECRTSWRDYLTWLEEHRTLTAEEIQLVAEQTFSERGRTVGYLIPEANGSRT
jgi:zinc protease